MLSLLFTATLLTIPQTVMAQDANVAQPNANTPAAIPGSQPGSFVLPAGTMLVVTPAQEISSKNISRKGSRSSFAWSMMWSKATRW